MANAYFDDPIHHLSGRISKKFRTCYNYRSDTGTKFTSVRGKRKTPVKASEIAARQKFASVAASTIERMHDITTLAADQRAFRAQSKYKTFFGWIFRQEWDAYEA